MKLSTGLEKYTNGTIQFLELVSKEVASLDEANELGYDDFKCNLYINGKLIADISPVLAKSEAWETMIEEVNWGGLYAEASNDIREHLKIV